MTRELFFLMQLSICDLFIKPRDFGPVFMNKFFFGESYQAKAMKISE